jgi:hypothetical protein
VCVGTANADANATWVVLRHVDQYFSDCAVLNVLVRVCCVCEREPVQRQAGVLADAQDFVRERERDVFHDAVRAESPTA